MCRPGSHHRSRDRRRLLRASGASELVDADDCATSLASLEERHRTARSRRPTRSPKKMRSSAAVAPRPRTETVPQAAHAGVRTAPQYSATIRPRRASRILPRYHFQAGRVAFGEPRRTLRTTVERVGLELHHRWPARHRGRHTGCAVDPHLHAVEHRDHLFGWTRAESSLPYAHSLHRHLPRPSPRVGPAGGGKASTPRIDTLPRSRIRPGKTCTRTMASTSVFRVTF